MTKHQFDNEQKMILLEALYFMDKKYDEWLEIFDHESLQVHYSTRKSVLKDLRSEMKNNLNK